MAEVSQDFCENPFRADLPSEITAAMRIFVRIIMSGLPLAAIDAMGQRQTVWYKSCSYYNDPEGTWVRSFLINKNLSLYYWLKKRTGKAFAFGVANTIEKTILVFGRERMPSRRIDIRNKVRRWELLFLIKKITLVWKLTSYKHVTR